MRWITFLVVFLLAVVFFVISEKNLNVANPGDLKILGSAYGDWVVSAVTGSVSFVGDIVNGDWIPDSGSNSTGSNLSENSS